MNFQQRVDALVQFAHKLGTQASDEALLQQAYHQNHWFTAEEVKRALMAWQSQITEEKLLKWLKPYSIPDSQIAGRTAIIMAGNIPLVGLHDLLCVLVSGGQALVKPSTDDGVWMKKAIELLQDCGFKEQIIISEERIPKDFDKVIATGSNNTNRYFAYYFKDKPSLLRKNRNGVAVLSGNETPDDYAKLGKDVFSYFGLGCRNVSKLYVPQGFNFVPFFEGIESFNSIIHHHKYANNYTYHKAIFLMNITKHYDNGFLLVKADNRTASPLGCLFYEEYENMEWLEKEISNKANEIQCVVSNIINEKWLPFGAAQKPELWDYADGVDTLAFLLA